MKDRVFLVSSVLLVVTGSVALNIGLNAAPWSDRPLVSEWMTMPVSEQSTQPSLPNFLAAATLEGSQWLNDRPTNLGLQARWRPSYMRRTSR